MPVFADTDYSRARLSFYDVECLEDAFTVTFLEPKTRQVRIFGLLNPKAVRSAGGHPLSGAVIDPDTLARRLWDENLAIHDWDGSGRHFSVDYYDLATVEGNMALANYFGAFAPTDSWIMSNRRERTRSWSVVRPDAPNRYEVSGLPAEFIRPVCDVHEDYDPNELHPFFVGYNSKNYDTSMMAIYISHAFQCLAYEANRAVGPWGDPADPSHERVFTPVDTSLLRRYSDELFSDAFINRMPRMLVESNLITEKDADWDSVPNLVRRAMIDSGRHVDMSELNEANQMIALKRQGVTIGRKVQESNKLGPGAKLSGIEDYYELCSYNLSDVILNARLFEFDEYNSQLDLKLSLMRTFPGTVYDREDENSYTPIEDPYHVKAARATVDTTSARFVSAILCPYERLSDLESVSFTYPHPEIAREKGVEPVDVLDEVIGFFRSRMAISEDDDSATASRKEAALEEIEHVYAFYDSIRGRNFNDSKAWIEDFGVQMAHTPSKVAPAGLEPMLLKERSEPHLLVPYYLPDGRPTSCYVNFSTGGIHGDEYRIDAVEARHLAQRRAVVHRWVAAHLFETPVAFAERAASEHDLIELTDDDGDVIHIDRRHVVTGATQATAKWKKPSKTDETQRDALELAQSLFDSAWDFFQAARPTARKWDVSAGRLTLAGGDVLEKKQLKAPTWKDPEAIEVMRATALPQDWQTRSVDDLATCLPRSALRASGLDPDAVALPFTYSRDTREGKGTFVVDPSPTVRERIAAGSVTDADPNLRMSLKSGEVVGSRAVLPQTINGTRDGATSVGEVIHEDFTSYYPNMLRNMRAFHNEQLGEDLYAQILADKDRYNVLKKEADRNGDEEIAARWNLLRNGTKLILNSASGAGDTAYDTSIRMNNRIISMRIIGQLFTWWIGQAQTFGADGIHALIPSTNTDGIYSVMEADVNNAILAAESERIGVEIEPESLFIASKDSNNRLELDVDNEQDSSLPLEERLRIVGAGGASLAAHKGPRVDKRLNHPVISDWALARYLRRIVADTQETPAGRAPITIDQACDADFIAELVAAKASERTPESLLFFQNVLASARSSYSYPAAFPFIDPDHPDQGLVLEEPSAIQHINRIFAVKPGSPGAIGTMRAVGKSVGAKERERRQEKHQPVRVIDPLAEKVFALNEIGIYSTQTGSFTRIVPFDRDVKLEVVTSLPATQPIIIDNRDLFCLTQAEIDVIVESLDLDYYARSVVEHFDANWRNAPLKKA